MAGRTDELKKKEPAHAGDHTAGDGPAAGSRVFFAYLLRCRDGSYYGGYTNDPERRLKVHNSGKGAKYTKSRRPCVLAYVEECGGKSAAMRREAALKRLSHEEKRLLEVSYERSREHGGA